MNSGRFPLTKQERDFLRARRSRIQRQRLEHIAHLAVAVLGGMAIGQAHIHWMMGIL